MKKKKKNDSNKSKFNSPTNLLTSVSNNKNILFKIFIHYYYML